MPSWARPGVASSASPPASSGPTRWSRSPCGESIPLRYAGGSAVVHHDPDVDAWWYSATAADQREEESEAVHGTYAEAIAAATEFLLAHALPAGQEPA